MASTRLQSAPKRATAPQALSMKLLSSALLVALAGLSAPVLAIDDDPGTALLRTSFASPGARAAGMGGAFIGLADDSSAAFLNPAGILLLSQKEITLEMRHRDPDALGLGTIAGPAVRSTADTDTDVSYASFAMPIPDKKIGFGVFYGKLSGSEFGTTFSDDVEVIPEFIVGAGSTRVALEDSYFGVSGALELTQGLRIGVSAYQVTRELRSSSVYSVGLDEDDEEAFFVYDGRTDDSDIGFNIGAHWTVNDAWSVGVAHRSATEFGAEYRFNFLNATSFPTSAPFGEAGTNVIPSATTLGVGWRATERVVLALDVARVRHSQIVDDAERAETIGTFLLTEPGDLAADDSTDIRFGAEFLIPKESGSWFLRAGLAREGSSSIRTTNSALPEVRPFFSGRDDETHATLGVGYAGEKFGIDAAFDRSDSNSEFVASLVIML